MSASIDKEAAALLNDLPAEGATASHLAETTSRAPEQVQAALEHLLKLRLVELEGQTWHPTPFVKKARNVFRFVG